jgi:hypothetical protein
MTLRQTYLYESISAVCVERSIDSLNSAIHNAYHILLRPSSLWEPRHPSLIVNNNRKCMSLVFVLYLLFIINYK